MKESPDTAYHLVNICSASRRRSRCEDDRGETMSAAEYASGMGLVPRRAVRITLSAIGLSNRCGAGSATVVRPCTSRSVIEREDVNKCRRIEAVASRVARSGGIKRALGPVMLRVSGTAARNATNSAGCAGMRFKLRHRL